MCFFKSLEFGNGPAIEPCLLNCHQLSNSFLPIISYFAAPYPAPAQDSIPLSASLPYHPAPFASLPEICARIQANNQNLNVFAKKLQKNEKILQKADGQILQMLQKSAETVVAYDSGQLALGNRKKTSQNSSLFLTKIFGAKTYKYRLLLKVDLPKIIYKERRLSLSVRLVSQGNTPVRNVNLLHLCLAACDLNGHWMVGQEEGFYMLGRTEVDLYKGEAEFQKVYPADISRHCPGGKVSLIIYPKPSLLNLTGDVFKGEAVINHEEVEPLCLQNILVKAKKRPRY